jgi:hypothetical protein
LWIVVTLFLVVFPQLTPLVITKGLHEANHVSSCLEAVEKVYCGEYVLFIHNLKIKKVGRFKPTNKLTVTASPHQFNQNQNQNIRANIRNILDNSKYYSSKVQVISLVYLILS